MALLSGWDSGRLIWEDGGSTLLSRLRGSWLISLLYGSEDHGLTLLWDWDGCQLTIWVGSVVGYFTLGLGR